MTFENLIKIIQEKKEIVSNDMIPNNLGEVFGLLRNDKFFIKQFNNISKKFSEDIQTYKQVKGFTEYLSGIKNIKRLEKNKVSCETKLAMLETELTEKTKIINRTNLPPSEKNKMELDIAVIGKKIQTLKSQKNREKVKRRKSEYDLKIEELINLMARKEEKYKQAMLPKSDIEKVKVDIFDLGKNIKKHNDKLMKVENELNEIYSQVEIASSNNSQVNADSLDSLLELASFTASKLLKSSENYSDTDIQILNTLIVEDESNPIIEYGQNYPLPEDDTELLNISNLSFYQIKKMINNSTIIKTESFDNYFDDLIMEMHFDEDDYKTDLIEILEKCTKATKKTSSTRKGKKWMKCAKQPDGSYKKIHFGQKGVRVGGGNSKRAKAFRARHDCANAKPGSAKAESCKNWS
jgi:hypothetical protein